ncbi:MAG: hypothetical protein QXE18_00685 [Thermoplasmata archaeon]
MEIGEILLIIIMLIILTFVIYIAAGISTSDWDLPLGIWLRFFLIAACATVLIPLLQVGAHWVGAGDLGLLIAFIILMLLVRFIVMSELTVVDEWMATVMTSTLVVIILYVIEKLAAFLFNVRLFSFV